MAIIELLERCQKVTAHLERGGHPDNCLAGDQVENLTPLERGCQFSLKNKRVGTLLFTVNEEGEVTNTSGIVIRSDQGDGFRDLTELARRD